MKPQVILLLVIGVAIVFCGWGINGQQTDEQMAYANGRWGPKKVVVMTRNVYVGADVDKVIGAEDPEDIPGLVYDALLELVSTDFPERAVALAKEIKWKRPHLVGLQEISLIEVNLPDYGMVFSYDFEDILMDAISSLKLDYKFVERVKNTDVTINLNENNSVRLVDYDVVIARDDVEIMSHSSANYIARLPVPNLGIDILRGYVDVTAKVGRKTYRFVNTHLEPFLMAIKEAQAQELIAALAGETKPIILVGDLNAPAPEDPVYQFFLTQGYLDTWTQNKVHSNPEGYTAGHDSDLRNKEIKLDRRIDLILVKNNGMSHIGQVIAFVTGDELKDRTPSGLWPSDHAGVISQLKIPGN